MVNLISLTPFVNKYSSLFMHCNEAIFPGANHTYDPIRSCTSLLAESPFLFFRWIGIREEKVLPYMDYTVMIH